jgi:hypothetical protein
MKKNKNKIKSKFRRTQNKNIGLGPFEPDIVMHIKVEQRAGFTPRFRYNKIIEREMLHCILLKLCDIQSQSMRHLEE